MSNVIPFYPRHKKALFKHIEDLEELYLSIHIAEDALNKLDEIASRVEEDYNRILRGYISEVGSENVEVLFLEYSTDVEIVFDSNYPQLKLNPTQLDLFEELK